jgi:hypothetical protein
MLLNINGKLMVVKLKSSSFSYNRVVSLPPASILSKISKYEAEGDYSVLSLISTSPSYMESIYEWNCPLLIDKTLAIYLNVELKATTRG